MPLPIPDNLAFIAVGSNVEPQRHIPSALTYLQTCTQVLASSTFYQTEPVGPPNQPVFVNGVWLVATGASPQDLTQKLQDIERRLGRVRSIDKYAPRPIDLDLILFNDWINGVLHLPHNDLKRTFVHQPIREILNTHAPLPYGPHWQEVVPHTSEICGVALPSLTQALHRHLAD